MIVLYRIDDRLIHGQVVVGWGQRLGIGFIVLVNDEVRASDWEQELYRMGVPPSIEVVFAGVAEAAHRGHAGHRFSPTQRPLNRRRSSVFGKKRGVQVDAPQARKVNQPFREDVTVGNHYQRVRPKA